MRDVNRKRWGFFFSIVLGVLFLLDGGLRLAGIAVPYGILAIMLYPGWFTFIAGAGMLLTGVLLFAPGVRFYGALGAIVFSAIGIATCLTAGQLPSMLIPLALLVWSWNVAIISMPASVAKVVCGLPLIRMTHSCKVAHNI